MARGLGCLHIMETPWTRAFGGALVMRMSDPSPCLYPHWRGRIFAKVVGLLPAGFPGAGGPYREERPSGCNVDEDGKIRRTERASISLIFGRPRHRAMPRFAPISASSKAGRTAPTSCGMRRAGPALTVRPSRRAVAYEPHMTTPLPCGERCGPVAVRFRARLLPLSKGMERILRKRLGNAPRRRCIVLSMRRT